MKSPWWPVLLAEQQAGRLIAAEQAVGERWEEIGQGASSLILLTQLSILLFLKHIQGFLISLLRAEPRTYIMYVWSEKSHVLDEKNHLLWLEGGEKALCLWAGTQACPSLEVSRHQPPLPVSYRPVLFSSTSWSTWWLLHITLRFWSLRVGKIAALSSKLHKADKEH